jgi:hypothetical protein
MGHGAWGIEEEAMSQSSGVKKARVIPSRLDLLAKETIE